MEENSVTLNLQKLTFIDPAVSREPPRNIDRFCAIVKQFYDKLSNIQRLCTVKNSKPAWVQNELTHYTRGNNMFHHARAKKIADSLDTLADNGSITLQVMYKNFPVTVTHNTNFNQVVATYYKTHPLK